MYEGNIIQQSVGTNGGYGNRKQHTTKIESIKNLEKLFAANMIKVNFVLLKISFKSTRNPNKQRL